jgi:branched-chain amino acid transport system permease protein
LENILQIIVTGFLLGAVYGLASLGMGLIFGVMGVLNLAHGAFMVLGGTISWFLINRLGAGLSITLPVVVLTTASLGVFLWKWGLAPPFLPGEEETGTEDLSSQLLVTLGFSLLVEDLVARWTPQGIFSIPFSSPLIMLSGASFSSMRLIVLLMVIIAFFLFNRMLMKTDAGLMVRALIQERQGAVLMSVPYRIVSVVVFTVGCAMAGLAGIFYSIIYPLTPQMSIPLTVKALLVVILGGTGKFMNTLVAAIFLGVIEVATGFWTGAETQQVVPYMALVALLLIRPEGIGSFNKNRVSL